jgi:hypothetical protein
MLALTFYGGVGGIGGNTETPEYFVHHLAGTGIDVLLPEENKRLVFKR